MKRPIILSLIGIIALGGFAVLEMPADVFVPRILASGGVAPTAITGRFSSGQSGLRTRGGRDLGRIRWQFTGLALRGCVIFDLDLDRGPVVGQAKLYICGGDRVELHTIRASAAVGDLAEIAGWGSPVSGDLRLLDATLRMQSGTWLGAGGRAEWVDAAITTPAVQFGRLLVAFGDIEGGFMGNISTPGDNPVGISGKIAVKADGRYSVSLSVDPRGDAQLAQLISTMGAQRDGGGYRLNWAARLPALL